MNIVIKVDEDVKNQMIEYYKDKLRDKKIPYVIFQAQEEDTVITMYESGKVMFQGTSADIDAARWGIEIEQNKEKNINIKDNIYYNTTSIGSDEVGTGDYFGPIIVTSCLVKKEDIKTLEELGVADSKKLDDEKIKKIAPKIAKLCKYKSLILSNKEYNEKYNKDLNLNKIKAIMHNKVLLELVSDTDIKYDYIIVDEFARENKYYDYLKEVKDIQRNITFLTKAEDKSLAVASASIISRYLFLREFDKLSDSINIPLLKGAGVDVDKLGEEIVEKYGKEKLKEIAKYNFKNTDRILHTLIY